MTIAVQPTASRPALTLRRRQAWALSVAALALMIIAALFEGKAGPASATVDVLARLAPVMILLAVYWAADERGRQQASRVTAIAALVTLVVAPLICLEAAVGILFTLTTLLTAWTGILAVARTRLQELREDV